MSGAAPAGAGPSPDQKILTWLDGYKFAATKACFERELQQRAEGEAHRHAAVRPPLSKIHEELRCALGMVEALEVLAEDVRDLLCVLFKSVAVDLAERGDSDAVVVCMTYIYRVSRDTLDFRAVRALRGDAEALRTHLLPPPALADASLPPDTPPPLHEAVFSEALVHAAQHWFQARGLGYLLLHLVGCKSVRVRRRTAREEPPTAAAAAGPTLAAFGLPAAEGGEDEADGAGDDDVVMVEERRAPGGSGGAAARQQQHNILALRFEAAGPCDFSHGGWEGGAVSAGSGGEAPSGYAVAACGDRVALHSDVAPPRVWTAGTPITDVAALAGGYAVVGGVDGAARLLAARAGGCLSPGRAELHPLAAYHHPHGSSVVCLAPHPAAPSLLACGVVRHTPAAHIIAVWATEHTVAPVRVLQAHTGTAAVTTALAFHPARSAEGPHLVSADDMLRVWDVRAAGGCAMQFQTPVVVPASVARGACGRATCTALAFAGEHTLVAGTEEGTLAVFDLRRGMQRHIPVPGAPVAMSHCGRGLAVAVACGAAGGGGVVVCEPHVPDGPCAAYLTPGVHATGVRWVSDDLIVCGTALV